MYTEKQIKTGRAIVIACWIYGLLAFFPPLNTLSIGVLSVGGLGRALFGILFCVHLVEFVFFRGLYAAAGGSMFGHFLRHMVYGVLYKTEVEQAGAAA